MAELSNFQKQILFGNRGETLFTQHEYDKAVAEAKAEIITVAIEATKYAISMEREECALLADSTHPELAQQIRDRALIKKH